ncbi:MULTISPECIES: hypothetical protein [unclassified Pseudomonas]|uniref:hypothetical protein n=1 Tax=unclassified Pseudomonas TaxID=196821 RepID=UPI002AC9E6A0|nr:MULTISPECIES: hypothetical protein [unclassified Pseudomonas]MEB0040047.1 hypothetical protein [Pseudomonas sp. MH10]MEB0076446.1 hypothetical protein [Pseudomonas sp. MH10out]MEB0091205.1 hypothetical protein [Pseudomonas sp. CCI4.2]MEB0100841.1 hypothetical protein [Pseudomonas sp. CCI3.2]MEB0119573.1 hypothetical protein [Pseudomonas sp. CCI1.2]
MKLVPRQELSQWDQPHAYPAEIAARRVKRALDRGVDIKGLERMRAALSVDMEHKNLDQLKTGQWLLIKQDTDVFQCPLFETAAARIRIPSAPVNMTQVHDDPDQYKPKVTAQTHDQYLVFKDQDDNPLQNIRYLLKTMEGQNVEGRSDFAGRTRTVSGNSGESLRCVIAYDGESL